MSRRSGQRPQENIWDVFQPQTTPPPYKSFLPNINPDRSSSRHSTLEPEQFVNEQLPSIELRGKIRDLEIQMVDIRGTLERKVSSVSEEFPNRLQRELRVIQERDTELWKENTTKIETISEVIKMVQTTSKQAFEKIGVEVSTLRRKIEEVEIKAVSSQVVQPWISQSIAPPSSFTDESYQIDSLKEALTDERKRRENTEQEYSKEIRELQDQLVYREREMNKKLQEYREEVAEGHLDIREQHEEMDLNRHERVRSEHDNLRGVISSLQRRLDEESEQRLSLEKEYKQWTDNRLTSVQSLIKADERNLADRERNILALMQEGLGALHEIIKRGKQANMVNLSKIQSIMNENIKDLTSAIAVIKDNMHSRLESLEVALEDEGKIRVENEQNIQMHFSSFAEALDRQATNMENAVITSENRAKQQIFELQEEFFELEEKELKHKNELEGEIKRVSEKLLNRLQEEYEEISKKLRELIEVDDMLKRKIILIEEKSHSEQEQLLNNLAYEAEVNEKKLNSVVTKALDDSNKDIHNIRINLEKKISEIVGDSNTLITRKFEEAELKTTDKIEEFIQKESEARKQALSQVDSSLRTLLEDFQETFGTETKSKLSDLLKKSEEVKIETDALQAIIKDIREDQDEIAESLETKLDGNHKDLQDWTLKQLEQQSELMKEDFDLLIATERELLLSEIDKTKKAFTSLPPNPEVEILTKQNIELTNKVMEKLEKEIKERESEEDLLENRINQIGEDFKESIESGREALKILCKALVTESNAERLQSEEQIVNEIREKLGETTQILKAFASEGLEELKKEVEKEFETEGVRREEVENKGEIGLLMNEIISAIVDEDIETQVKSKLEILEVNECINSLLNQVADKELFEREASTIKMIEEMGETETLRLEEVENGVMKRIFENEDKKDVRAVVDTMLNTMVDLDMFEKENRVSGVVASLGEAEEEIKKSIEESSHKIELIERKMISLESVINDAEPRPE